MYNKTLSGVSVIKRISAKKTTTMPINNKLGFFFNVYSSSGLAASVHFMCFLKCSYKSVLFAVGLGEATARGKNLFFSLCVWDLHKSPRWQWFQQLG